MTISDFIARCDAYVARSGLSQATLSKRLFADSSRLKNLAAGKSDVGVNRLALAVQTLRELERELEQAQVAQDAAA
jgi:hypothetical protein